MNESDFVLYDALNSPAGRRVRITLLEKGVDAEIRWQNLALMDQKRPDFLRLNPSGLVPVLVHGPRVLFESTVINEYLDNLLPDPPLVPRDAWEQAEMRMWCAFEQEWAKPFRDAIYETYAKTRLQSSGVDALTLPAAIAERTPNPVYARIALGLLNRPADNALLRDRLDVLMERMEWMDQRLTDGRMWLLGDMFSLADIALAPRIDMFPFIGVDDLDRRFVRIGAFMRRMRARPSWAASAIAPAPGSCTGRLRPQGG